MTPLVLFCKSYSKDLPNLKLLVESVEKYNRDQIPLYISVPRSELTLFWEEFKPNPTALFIADEDICDELTTKEDTINTMSVGWINQQLVKLMFWRTGIAENYFCVDSEAYFIRPFYARDFMYDEHTPYTTLIEDNELKVDPDYYQAWWPMREAVLRDIMFKIELDEQVMLTAHGNLTMNYRVLKSLEQEFMTPRGWTYQDLLRDNYFEFSWYNFWLQKTKVIPIHAREPVIKIFHQEGQFVEYKLREITESDIGLLLN